jgi:hypothetical protein
MAATSTPISNAALRRDNLRFSAKGMAIRVRVLPS